MKGTGHGRFGGRYIAQDDDWEVSQELSPDPFSEEEHSLIHGRRFSQTPKRRYMKQDEKAQNQEISEDITE